MEPAAVHFHHGNYSASAADSQPALYDKDDGTEYSTSLINTTGDYGDYYYYYDYYFEIYPFEINTLGIVLPILVGLTTLSNVFVAGFFLTRKDRGKSTNLLFVSIAFSDTMTGITLLPNAFGVYAKNLTLMSKETCNMYMLLRFYFSPVFHTVSVWQTVVLCIQRYLCVCHPFISGRICTFRNTFISIVVMYILAIVLHVYHLLDNKIGHLRCRWRTETPCKESCMYLWFCVVLQHLLPCILLVVLTLITILKLATAQKRVSTMAHRSRSANRSARDKIITYTAALIVVFFLLPEFPHGVYKLVFVIYKHSSGSIPAYYNHIIISIYELFLTVSFCANFWIYCCMMRDFRRKLLELITCGSIKLSFDRLRSFSASSKRGSVRTTLSRSSSNASRNRVFSRTTSLHSTASENIHAVIPMTPTRGYDHVNFHEQPSLKMKDDDINDDVFV